MYVPASVYASGDKAAFASSYMYRASGGGCMSFYYHMYGAGQGTLNIYTHQVRSARKCFSTALSSGKQNVSFLLRCTVDSSPVLAFEVSEGNENEENDLRKTYERLDK